jgi:hypothetical protein
VFSGQNIHNFCEIKILGIRGGEQTLGMKSGDFGTFFFGEFSPLDVKKKPSSTHTKGIFVKKMLQSHQISRKKF